MKVKNQIVVISAILVLLAIATISAANYVVQPASAQTPPGKSGSAYGNQVIKPNPQLL